MGIMVDITVGHFVNGVCGGQDAEVIEEIAPIGGACTGIVVILEKE